MFVRFLLFISVLAITNCREIELLSKEVDVPRTRFEIIKNDKSLLAYKLHVQSDIVKIQVLYESLCYGCRQFDAGPFLNTYMKLEKYLDVHTYPYGNAMTVTHEDGSYQILCQHGPPECYGNMLHACAIDILANTTSSINFNACLMDTKNSGDSSNDATAVTCGKLLNIDAGPIKECAKSKKGKELHKYYGEETQKFKHEYVPYVFINGEKWDYTKNFMKSVCEAFKEPPSPCAEADII